jgi:branched-chain amino acid transport system ATP-binding protein
MRTESRIAEAAPRVHASLHTDALLEARGVRVHIRGVRAVDGVDLALRQGEILGLIGPNGAGKTTLVNVLSGFQRATSGLVALDGRNATAWAPAELARAGVVRTFQDVRLFSSLSVFENVEAAALSSGSSRRDARALSSELLGRLQLEQRGDAGAGGLAHGEERRLAIARALAARPQFLLLDEPAAGLNEAESDALVSVLAAIRAAFALGVLVIEHDMRLIMQLADRIQVLDHGKTIATGTPTQIRNNPAVRTAYLGSGSKADAQRP